MGGKRVLGLVLAGGVGRRLGPLTADRAKSAVPFGGLYRVVDFALSNLVNGGIRRIYVLTQYKSHSLNKHITTTRYRPPKGTADLARSAVSGPRRLPTPPARTSPRTLCLPISDSSRTRKTDQRSRGPAGRRFRAACHKYCCIPSEPAANDPPRVSSRPAAHCPKTD